MNLLEQAGGIDGLRRVITDFYDTVFEDVMIGFMFRRANKKRLIERELELIAAHFGAENVRYTGRPMREAHAAHKIMGGMFDRRMVLLKEAIERHQLPGAVKEAWLQHASALRNEVTNGPCE